MRTLPASPCCGRRQKTRRFDVQASDGTLSPRSSSRRRACSMHLSRDEQRSLGGVVGAERKRASRACEARHPHSQLLLSGFARGLSRDLRFFAVRRNLTAFVIPSPCMFHAPDARRTAIVRRCKVGAEALKIIWCCATPFEPKPDTLPKSSAHLSGFGHMFCASSARKGLTRDLRIPPPAINCGHGHTCPACAAGHIGGNPLHIRFCAPYTDRRRG